MASHAEDLVDAAVSHLNGLSLSQTFTATKRLFPRRRLEDISGLVVDVFLPGEGWERVTKGNTYYRTYDLTVAVAVKVNDDNSSLGTWLQFMEEVKEALTSVKLDSLPCVGLNQPELYSMDHLQGSGLFLSQAAFQYRRVK